MQTFSFGQHVKEIGHYVNKVEFNFHFKRTETKTSLKKLLSIVRQFAHLWKEWAAGTAGSERPTTLLPAGGNLEQLQENYCWVI